MKDLVKFALLQFLPYIPLFIGILVSKGELQLAIAFLTVIIFFMHSIISIAYFFHLIIFVIKEIRSST